MDSNGLRSFGLAFNAGLQAWRVTLPGEERRVTVEPSYVHKLTALRLASSGALPRLKERPATAAQIALSPAMARDCAGNYVVWDAGTDGLLAVSHLAGQNPDLQPMPIELPASVRPVRDLGVTSDDVLVVAGGNALWLADLRARFEPLAAALPEGFVATKVAACPDGSVVLLDTVAAAVARFAGRPLAETGVRARSDEVDRFEAKEPNPDPPTVRRLGFAVDADERAIGIACAPDGAIAVLSVRQAGGARLRLLTAAGGASPAIGLLGPRFPHAIGWLDNERIALMTDGVLLDADGTPQEDRDVGVFVYAFPPALRERLAGGQAGEVAALTPTGDYYPTVGAVHGPFANGAWQAVAGLRLFYPRVSRFGIVEPGPVARISSVARTPYGVAANFGDDRLANVYIRGALGVIDAGNPTIAWHRLYVEGSLPANTAVIVWLAANSSGPPRFDPAKPSARADWYPHLFGDPRALPEEIRAALPPTLPRAAWVRDASEVPQGESLLDCERTRNVTGLFTVLIQRADLVVRTLQGRRLWVAVELFGDTRATPELVAIRAYAGRVSYRDRYLPALYHEQVFGADADRHGRATPADFIERFIDLFEGIFTTVEDRIANAHLVTDAMSCAPDALPWLASWIGLALEPGVPPSRARWMIVNAPRLARRHGTLDGMKLALDIATDGGVTRGRLVVVENFRLRRTLATILGANLVDRDDPLTAGIAQSGNSFVGDSLFLGEEGVKTFLALFRTLRVDPSVSSAAATWQREERDQAIHALYDGLAYRVTVLVHEHADEDELRVVRRLAEIGSPAHVIATVSQARYPFMVAVASLVGADTFIRSAEQPAAVTVGRSRLGYVDTLQGLGTFDAGMGAFAPPAGPGGRPIADAGPDRIEMFGQNFTLDGSASHVEPPRKIETYLWRLLQPNEPDQ